jgi:hypothetical protein
VIGNAVLIGRIVTGEVEDTEADPSKEHHRRAGVKGSAARADALTAEQRSEVAKKAAAKRWAGD